MQLHHACAWAVIALALSAAAAAQSPFLVVGTGDELAGIGRVTQIQAVHVDPNGSWLVQAATDNPAVPSVVVREGAVWTSFGEVRNAPLGGTFALTGTVDGPLLAGHDVGFLAVGSQFSSVGVCCEVQLLALEGRPAPGQTEAVERIRTEPWTSRVEFHGQRLYWSCDLAGSSAQDGCVFTCVLPQGTHTLLVQEGTPGPVPGRLWGPLENLSLDACGADWTLRTFLDPSDPASDGILVRNGAKLVQEGDMLAAIAPFAIDDLGGGRGALDVAGHVLWYGHWNDPNAPSEALFLDRSVLVRTGTVTLGGERLVGLGSGPHDYTLAPTGGYVLFTATLAGGGEGAFVLNLGKVKGYCTPKASSLVCLQSISTSGKPSAGAGSGFMLRAKGILSRVAGLLFYGTSGPVQLPLLDATLCVRPPLRRLPVLGSGGSGPTASACDGLLEVDINAWIAEGGDPGLGAGTTVFAQFWTRDPGLAPPLDFGLTQALEFTLAP